MSGIWKFKSCYFLPVCGNIYELVKDNYHSHRHSYNALLFRKSYVPVPITSSYF